MHVTVKLFARLRELVGAPELVRTTPAGATVADVWQALAAEHPTIGPYAASISCAVNADYAPMSTPVADGDEVAFLPPVSGGQECGASDFTSRHHSEHPQAGLERRERTTSPAPVAERR